MNRPWPFRLFMLFIAGGLCSLAMAPFNFWPILIIGLGFLYGVLMYSRPALALLHAWFFMFGYFVAGLLWVGNALLVDGNPFVWMMPLAIAGLPSLLACFMALGAFLAVRFSDLSRLSGFFSFCAFIAIFEWLRSFVFTGFPWNSFGYSWAGILQLIQILSFSNIYALNGLTLLWLVFPAFLIFGNATARQKTITAICLYGIFTLSFVYGTWRLTNASNAVIPDVQVKIVQANIPQSEKWKAEEMWGHFIKQVEMSAQGPEALPDKTTYIVWPETALSHWVLRDGNAMNFLTTTLRGYRGSAYIMTGLLRRHEDSGRYSNSFVMIDKTGRISNIYDKFHLVPFGEYIPFQKWIPLKPVVEFIGFQLGAGPATLQTPEGLKYSPVVCYEIIFSGKLTGPEKPDFIVNVTNDSWYGVSPGPYQHFTQARFRAIEEGIPVVRAASTGISGIIDPYGRILTQSDLFIEYNETRPIPAKLHIWQGKSLYATLIFLIISFLCISFGYNQKVRRAL